MTLIEKSTKSFVEQQKRLVDDEIKYWNDFRKKNSEGVYYAFWKHHRNGQILESGSRAKPEHEEQVRGYLNFPDVVEMDGIIVDLQAIQIPFNCFWKSCRLTGSYCCISKGPSNTDRMIDLMQNSGRRAIEKYEDQDRIEAIRTGETHTPTLSLVKQKSGLCTFGEDEYDEDPETGEEHPHVACRLHELAIEEDIPLVDVLGFGPTLFPADLLIVDGKWFITAASERAKEWHATRWYVTSDTNPCTTVGDTKPFGILQNPDMNSLYRRVFGDDTMDNIQHEAYGSVGPVEPEIQDGWIRSKERNLQEIKTECDECEGSGCGSCDQRGYYKVFLPENS